MKVDTKKCLEDAQDREKKLLEGKSIFDEGSVEIVNRLLVRGSILKARYN